MSKTVRFEDALLTGGYVMVPNAVLLDGNLSPQARLLYGLLAHYAREKESCWPGERKLAKLLDCTERTMRRYLKELKVAQLVSTTQRGRGKTQIYVLLSRIAGQQQLSPDIDDRPSPDTSDRENNTKREQDSPETSSGEGGITIADAAEDVFAYWQAEAGVERRTLTSKRRGVLYARLREFKPAAKDNGSDPWAQAAAQLKRAVDGACRDPWVLERGLQLKFDYVFRNEDRVEHLIGKAKHGAGGAASERAKAEAMRRRLRGGN